MKYELYTIPNCEQCGEVKNFLNEKNIAYEEINLINPESKKIFGEIYLGIEKKVRRTLHGKTILPLLVEKNGEGKVERIAQELDEVKSLFV